MRLLNAFICSSLLAICLVINSGIAHDQPFKINKLNLIWNKAQHSLGPNKLKDFKNDLLKHEPLEINLKKMKAHKHDEDVVHVEASVRKNLHAIMRKYSLERYYDDIHPITEAKTNDNKEVPTYRGNKLDKVWKKAEKAGFSHEQLMLLHEGFQHQHFKNEL
jgi:hypothetical protein